VESTLSTNMVSLKVIYNLSNPYDRKFIGSESKRSAQFSKCVKSFI
jgi:hypothetical protein